MEEKRYSITLADGTVLGDLRLNGNNYISNQPIDESVFEDNCAPVIISSNGENKEIHEVMELVQVAEVAGEYWFVLRDISTKELADIKLRSDVEYLAMMTGVEL